MKIRLLGRLFGLVLAGALGCVPLSAQVLYAEISVDGYGNLSGVSSLDIGSYSPMWEAYVQGEIDGPDGTYAAGPGFDDGSGYAEVDLYAAADLDGSYVEVTDASMETDLDEYYLGELDSDPVDFTGDCVPLGEYSTFLSIDYALPGGPGYGGLFRATLTGGQFQGDSLAETVSLISQSCSIPGVTVWGPPGGIITGATNVTPMNTYADIVGLVDFDIPNYYQLLINGVKLISR